MAWSVAFGALGALGCASGRGGAEAQSPAEEPPKQEETIPLSEPEPAPPPAAPEADSLEVPVQARSGSSVSGSARLEPVDGGVRIFIKIAGAPPGEHGTHIHQNADCSAADAASAGGHFNPEGHDHGRPADAQRHLGDLGNLTVVADGTGSLEIFVEGASLDPHEAHSFLGRGLIVHEKKDDGSQPVGNAGGRIGCAEIKR